MRQTKMVTHGIVQMNRWIRSFMLAAIMFCIALAPTSGIAEEQLEVSISNWDQMVEFVSELFLEATLSVSPEQSEDFNREDLAALEWYYGLHTARSEDQPFVLDYSTTLAYIIISLETNTVIEDEILILAAWDETDIIVPIGDSVEAGDHVGLKEGPPS